MPPDLGARLRAALGARPPRRLRVEGAREAAVLLPVVGREELTLILTVRAEALPSHRGQISFPGGSIDACDTSAEAAALREAHEELGLEPSLVEVVGELDSIPTFVSGFVVTPVVGWLAARPALSPNPAEVARVLEVPLDELSEEIRADAGFSHRGRTYPTEAWIWRDHVIWGVTARILRLLLVHLASAGVVQRPGDERTPWAAP